MFSKVLFCLHFSFPSIFLICHTQIVQLCLNMPMIFHLVVHPVLAPMLIFNVVWILLSIGPLNKLCRLTHPKVLMCFPLSSLDKHIILTSFLSSLSINGTLIPQSQKLNYLGVYLLYNPKWSGHISSVFTKVRKLLFYVRRLRSFSTPQFLIDRFVFCCILPHILYCSSVVFCGLLSKITGKLFQGVSS